MMQQECGFFSYPYDERMDTLVDILNNIIDEDKEAALKEFIQQEKMFLSPHSPKKSQALKIAERNLDKIKAPVKGLYIIPTIQLSGNQ